MVLRSGLVRQSVRFPSDRHIVSRDNCYYSEIEKTIKKSGNEHGLPGIQGEYREIVAARFVP